MKLDDLKRGDKIYLYNPKYLDVLEYTVTAPPIIWRSNGKTLVTLRTSVDDFVNCQVCELCGSCTYNHFEKGEYMPTLTLRFFANKEDAIEEANKEAIKKIAKLKDIIELNNNL